MPDASDVTGMSDTSAEVLELQAECHRRMTPAQKLEIVAGLNRMVDAFALAGLRERHPQDDDETLRLRLLVLKYGPELVRAAYGRAPGA